MPFPRTNFNFFSTFQRENEDFSIFSDFSLSSSFATITQKIFFKVRSGRRSWVFILRLNRTKSGTKLMELCENLLQQTRSDPVQICRQNERQRGGECGCRLPCRPTDQQSATPPAKNKPHGVFLELVQQHTLHTDFPCKECVANCIKTNLSLGGTFQGKVAGIFRSKIKFCKISFNGFCFEFLTVRWQSKKPWSAILNFRKKPLKLKRSIVKPEMFQNYSFLPPLHFNIPQKTLSLYDYGLIAPFPIS